MDSVDVIHNALAYARIDKPLSECSGVATAVLSTERVATSFAPWSTTSCGANFNPLYSDGKSRLIAHYLLENEGKVELSEYMRHSAFVMLQMAYEYEKHGCSFFLDSTKREFMSCSEFLDNIY